MEGGFVILLVLHVEYDEEMLVVQVEEKILMSRLAMMPHYNAINKAEPEVWAKICLLSGVHSNSSMNINAR